MALSFAKDIRPLFRHTPDVDSMKEYGLDLLSYVEVVPRTSMRAWPTGARLVTGRGRQSTWPGLNAGWTKAWPLEPKA
jgi:hypothetical protein